MISLSNHLALKRKPAFPDVSAHKHSRKFGLALADGLGDAFVFTQSHDTPAFHVLMLAPQHDELWIEFFEQQPQDQWIASKFGHNSMEIRVPAPVEIGPQWVCQNRGLLSVEQGAQSLCTLAARALSSQPRGFRFQRNANLEQRGRVLHREVPNPRANIGHETDQSGLGQGPQRFPDGAATYIETLGQRHFTEALARLHLSSNYFFAQSRRNRLGGASMCRNCQQLLLATSQTICGLRYISCKNAG